MRAKNAKKVGLQSLDGYIISEKNGQMLLGKRTKEQRVSQCGTYIKDDLNLIWSHDYYYLCEILEKILYRVSSGLL